MVKTLASGNSIRTKTPHCSDNPLDFSCSGLFSITLFPQIFLQQQTMLLSNQTFHSITFSHLSAQSSFKILAWPQDFEVLLCGIFQLPSQSMSHIYNFHLSGDFSSTPGDFSFASTSYPTDPQYFSDFSNNHSNSSSTTGSDNFNNFSSQHSFSTPTYHSIQNFGGGNQLHPSSSFIPSDFSSSGNFGGGTGGGASSRRSSSGSGIYSSKPVCSTSFIPSSRQYPDRTLFPDLANSLDKFHLQILRSNFISRVSWASHLEPKIRYDVWGIYCLLPNTRPLFEEPSFHSTFLSIFPLPPPLSLRLDDDGTVDEVGAWDTADIITKTLCFSHTV